MMNSFVCFPFTFRNSPQDPPLKWNEKKKKKHCQQQNKGRIVSAPKLTCKAMEHSQNAKHVHKRCGGHPSINVNSDIFFYQRVLSPA